jgi:hypothetical protein
MKLQTVTLPRYYAVNYIVMDRVTRKPVADFSRQNRGLAGMCLDAERHAEQLNAAIPD